MVKMCQAQTHIPGARAFRLRPAPSIRSRTRNSATFTGKGARGGRFVLTQPEGCRSASSEDWPNSWARSVGTFSSCLRRSI
jgi:hypothetical protein